MQFFLVVGKYNENFIKRNIHKKLTRYVIRGRIFLKNKFESSANKILNHISYKDMIANESVVHYI